MENVWKIKKRKDEEAEERRSSHYILILGRRAKRGEVVESDPRSEEED